MYAPRLPSFMQMEDEERLMSGTALYQAVGIRSATGIPSNRNATMDANATAAELELQHIRQLQEAADFEELQAKYGFKGKVGTILQGHSCAPKMGASVHGGCVGARLVRRCKAGELEQGGRVSAKRVRRCKGSASVEGGCVGTRRVRRCKAGAPEQGGCAGARRVQYCICTEDGCIGTRQVLGGCSLHCMCR